MATGIGAATEVNILNLIFNATAWSGIAQNHGTPDTTVSVALQIANPTETGNMNTSPTAYSGYVQQTRTRTNASGGWTAATSPTGFVSPHTTAITFPAGTAGSSDSVTHFSVGKAAGGDIFWFGDVSPAITTGNGITPQLTTGTTITLE